jgi:hypothetical protein
MPVPEAIGHALTAVGELIAAIQAAKKAEPQHRSHRRKPRGSRASRRPARASKGRGAKDVVVAEAVRIRARPASTSRTSSRPGRRVVIDATTPAIVTPQRAAPPRTGEDSSRRP